MREALAHFQEAQSLPKSTLTSSQAAQLELEPKHAWLYSLQPIHAGQ